jgi:hypothetical protein
MIFPSYLSTGVLERVLSTDLIMYLCHYCCKVSGTAQHAA